jgi:hypothetical protein
MLSRACESCPSLVCPYHDASLPVWDNAGSVTRKKISNMYNRFAIQVRMYIDAAGYSITEGRSGTSIVREIKTEAMQEAEKVLSGFKRTVDKRLPKQSRQQVFLPGTRQLN